MKYPFFQKFCFSCHSSPPISSKLNKNTVDKLQLFLLEDNSNKPFNPSPLLRKIYLSAGSPCCTFRLLTWTETHNTYTRDAFVTRATHSLHHHSGKCGLRLSHSLDIIFQWQRKTKWQGSPRCHRPSFMGQPLTTCGPTLSIDPLYACFCFHWAIMDDIPFFVSFTSVSPIFPALRCAYLVNALLTCMNIMSSCLLKTKMPSILVRIFQHSRCKQSHMLSAQVALLSKKKKKLKSRKTKFKKGDKNLSLCTYEENLCIVVNLL